ncbi:hypothetical protein SAMN03080617_02004 [Algoriphagus alkaliphilus]|uniref:Uncharacterized protein n=1 Tax=Algoriphagus alkaliphilus TaxID=279824 RepID=A0A1G5XV71_9BACT|nr:hypothetical protein [Algoriphagus alkaliphilus]SDA74100.1 hypothetical protein SAMN03080617_02004 [Algoriphagus alkaliphilus]
MKIKGNRKMETGSILEVILKLSGRSKQSSKTREIYFWDNTESFKGNTKEAIMNDIENS